MKQTCLSYVKKNILNIFRFQINNNKKKYKEVLNFYF